MARSSSLEPHVSSLFLAPGRPYPLGATLGPDGVNFAFFSKNSTAAQLLLFDRADDPEPARVLTFDPVRNRTFYYWHACVAGLRAGQVYGYRVDGPFQPARGHRFDPGKLLIDPYARSILLEPQWSRDRALGRGDTVATGPRCVVVDTAGYDWEGDRPLGRPLDETVIYELNARGFTRHPSSGVRQPGSFTGLVEKIPYLQELGITAVELMPIYQFDPQECAPGLSNYWGYSPVGFFAPCQRYGASPDPLDHLREFRDLVKALHRAGIEVILDVVYNHTAEGGPDGPTFGYRGLENRAYYMLGPNPAEYLDYTGCRNTFNSNHSVVRRLILDSLRFWVSEMHVDGFRFDLASILARDEQGQPVLSAPVIWAIESDPVLAGTKLIAEAWDAAGLYQVGNFGGERWADWSGPFRDDVRRFLRGDPATVSALATRLTASTPLDQTERWLLYNPVTFVTAHDGFTLNDLVSYDRKHNEANREGNRDGSDWNFSWNCGVEGPTDDPAIERLRDRQVRNFLVLLLVSQGTPMLLMGDEVRRTQGGNNNAYCQDNGISWLDWSSMPRHAGLRRFVRHLVRLRRRHPTLHRRRILTSRPPGLTWHGVRAFQPDWADYSHTLAFHLDGVEGDDDFYVAINAYSEELAFELPPPGRGRAWLRVVDTARESPDDIAEPDREATLGPGSYPVQARSVIVLRTGKASMTDGGP